MCYKMFRPYLDHTLHGQLTSTRKNTESHTTTNNLPSMSAISFKHPCNNVLVSYSKSHCTTLDHVTTDMHRVMSQNVSKHTSCKWISKRNIHEAFLINKWNTASTAQSWQQGTINFSPASQLASSVLADGMVEVVEFATVVVLGTMAPPELTGWSGSRSRDREARLRAATWLDAEGSTEVLSGLDEVRRTKLAVVLGLLVSMADPETASSAPGAPSSAELSPCWK